jgi:hypothetical protein
MPTGWQVVKELVRRAAVAQDPESPPPSEDAEIEQWWTDHGTGELGYASVLEALASTPAARQALLEGFFSQAEDEDGQRRGPSQAHRALARLVASGYVKVVLTTNFDRLMEQALEEEGVHPQVVSRPEAVAGMKPLAHASATVVKLHGDYKDLTTRNTPAELDTYPSEWQQLIGQVLDEYGLLVVGWSADWDTALVRVIEAAPSRRYPMYWDGRSGRGKTAQQVLANRDGVLIQTPGADALFTELENSVTALAKLAEPPLTTAMAVARLKRHLLDPTRRIDVHDIVMSKLDPIHHMVQTRGARPVATTVDYERILADYREASMPLLRLLAVGVRHDTDSTHRELWAEVLRSLMTLRRPPDGTYNPAVWHAQHYPALLAFYVIGVATMKARTEELFIELARNITWQTPFGNKDPEPAAHVLQPDRVLDWESINSFTRWNNTQWQQPPSHLVRADLEDVIDELTIGGDTSALFDDLEYRHSLLVFGSPGHRGRPLTGEYRGDRHWGGDKLTAVGQRFRAAAARAGTGWPWWETTGADLETALTELEDSAGW